jgi:anaerobic magnesium-protoporphyrin IX monomethyl ester cyclase
MDTPNLDAICVGEGEYPTLELADAFEKGAPNNDIQNSGSNGPSKKANT